MSFDRKPISLAAARTNAEMTREEVEAVTGIKKANLGRYERGEIEPRASDLQKLCFCYQVGIEDLRFDVGKKAQDENKGEE